MDKPVLYGLLVLACCFTVILGAPKDDSDYQGDDYEDEYATDDQNTSTQQGTGRASSATTNILKPYFSKSQEAVVGTIGKNISLECDVKNFNATNVILWYKEQQLVIAKDIFSPAYKMVNNRDLLILNATVSSQGDYYCVVEPSGVRKHIHVSVGEHPMEAIVPESSVSESGTAALASSSILFLPIAALLALQRR